MAPSQERSTTEPARYGLALALLSVFVAALAGWILIGRLAPPTKAWVIGRAALLMGGTALGVAGLVGLLFQRATRRSYEWLLAWRYLRVQHRRSWTTLGVGVALLLIGGGVMAASYVWGGPRLEELMPGPSGLQRVLRFGALGIIGLGHWVTFFGLLMLFFSLFTTISIFTVFLGLEALVAVLSMMGGFEYDLRHKILGATAHVVITQPQGAFESYERVLPAVERVEEVVAVSPFLESEVMITSQTNLSGVLLRGIDPQRIKKVTELERFLESDGGSGNLTNLANPERLARIPESRFRPLVTKPLGPDEREDEAGGAAAPEGTGAERERGRLSEGDLLDVEDEVARTRPARPLYPGIIIGAELAKNLRVYVGDDVNVVAPLGGMSPAGPIPKSKPFRVAGIFYSGLYEYDNKYVYVTIPVAQRFLGLGDEISGIEVKVDELEAAGPVADRIRARFGGSGLKVADWRERNVNLFSALKLEKLVMFIVLTFIVLVASFSIVTNLNMVVLEKMREIAVLKSMGASHWSILKVFLGAGFYIGFLGALVGVLAGIGICTFLKHVGLPLDPEIYYISELPVRMDPLDIAVVGIGGVFISFLATIYPAILAASLKPVDGMRRHEI